MINCLKRFSTTILSVCIGFICHAQSIDLTHASIIVLKDGQNAIQKPITVLQEEVYKRTGIALAVKNDMKPAAPLNEPRIILATSGNMSMLPASLYGLLRS